MKKLSIINLVVAFLLLSGCTVYTPDVTPIVYTPDVPPIESTRNDSDNPPGTVCRKITMNSMRTSEGFTSSSSDTSKICKKTTDLVDPNDMHDLIINIKDCDVDDYETNILGKTTNDRKGIRYRILDGVNSKRFQQGEIEQCMSLDDGKTFTNWYFKIKNCDTLFNCSLVITNDNSELVIGPFTNDYGTLYLINKRGIEINQSNMPGVAVATTGELHKIRIGQRYYLSNTLNPSDRLIQSLEEL